MSAWFKGLILFAAVSASACYDTTIPAPKGPPGTNPADYPALTDSKRPPYDAGVTQ